MGVPCASVSKEFMCNAGNPGLIPELGRSSRVTNGNPLQFSCLGNPTDRGAWQAIVHGVANNQTQLRDKRQQWTALIQNSLAKSLVLGVLVS